jgi:hypothetical protein
MFNIFYNTDTGYIHSYHEGAPLICEGVVQAETLDIKNKRVDPDTKQIIDMPENLVGEQRCMALYHEAVRTPEGSIIEIGVYKGGSAWYLSRAAKKKHCKLHLFDTFEGIPYQSKYDETPVGCFGDVDLEKVKAYLPRATFHVGVFPKTLPASVQIEPIAFVHFDGDQYQGVKDVKTYLWPCLVSGGKIFFDDSSLHGGMTGVNKAIDEDFPQYKIHEYVRMKYVIKP